MEIGSFLELDINPFGEYYTGNQNVARLNSARCGIYHSLCLYNCSTVYLPYYLCPSVSDFLTRKGIKIKKYYINKHFEPQISSLDSDAAILIVNYFGILSEDTLNRIKENFNNVIIDNCPSFYSNPLDGCYNVYSTRKFFGVPDGCYVIGNNAEKYTEKYKQDFSAETSAFLLKRLETGCNAAYPDRMINEKRLDESDILNMSELTNALLKGIDYQRVKEKRKDNFQLAMELYADYNLINPDEFVDQHTIPMVYPLVIEDSTLVDKLRERQIYTGRWWKSVLAEVPGNSFEAWLSSFMVPIPIDQRYSHSDMEFVYKEVVKSI